MHPTHAHTRLVAAATAVVLALAPGAATAANESAGGDSARPAIVLAELGRDKAFIPGVTDSGTGVLRELERRRNDRFIPGVTDSGTGVLRELERRKLQRPEAPAASVGDSGLGFGLASIAAGAAFAAAAVAGAIVVVGAVRDRRLAT